jgi:uncharacterized protein YjbJ (UPF0337 family)
MMTAEQLKANWMTLKGKIKEEWGKLTDDDLDVAEGQLEQVAGKISARYAVAKEKVMERLQKLHDDCGCH